MPTLHIAVCTVTDHQGITEVVRREPDRIMVQQGRALKPDPKTGLIPPAPPLTWVEMALDEATARLNPKALQGVFHYLRQSDATLIPLPPEYPEAGHKLVAWKLAELGIAQNQAFELALRPGDAYVAVTPGASRLADGTAIARFIHLRDYFNAERMAQALADEICSGRARPDEIPAAFTTLVIEAR
ncbi:MAG TPA: hypothetical protein PK954_06900 [Anaerolineales bacterium]|nr:hypothetical protein [Anaerolineales bacterium]